MDVKEYQKKALRTNASNYKEITSRFAHEDVINIIHAGIGLTTESGEFNDALKKHLFYGSKLNTVNLKEELGDILWYIAIAAESLNTNIEDLMDINIKKLESRYPIEFNLENCLNRDIKKERKILKGGDCD